MDRIVGIGVAHFSEKETKSNGPLPLRKYLAFTAGSDYAFLDQVQCEFSFIPTQFDVAVNITGQNIIVAKLNDSKVDDIDPKRYLKGITLRQFKQMANDETNLYVSTVGAAFNASISDLQTFHRLNSTLSSLSGERIILQAVENSLTTMADDILGAYAAAQLLIGKFYKPTSATIQIPAIAFGEMRFSIAVFAVNTIILLCLLVEIIQIKAWKDLPEFDPTDIRHVVVAAAEGGQGLANIVFGQKCHMGDVKIQYVKIGRERFAIMAEDGQEMEDSEMEVNSIEREGSVLVNWSNSALNLIQRSTPSPEPAR